MYLALYGPEGLWWSSITLPNRRGLQSPDRDLAGIAAEPVRGGSQLGWRAAVGRGLAGAIAPARRWC